MTNEIPIIDQDESFLPVNQAGEYCSMQDITRTILALKKLFIDSTTTNTISYSMLHILIERLDASSSDLINELQYSKLKIEELKGDLTEDVIKKHFDVDTAIDNYKNKFNQ